MVKYVALLRGINVGGNNKISMTQLKISFTNLKFSNIKTYINSGNIMFESDITDKNILIKLINKKIIVDFNLDVPISLLTKSEILSVVSNAPVWWGTLNKEIYHNTIFMILPIKPIDVYNIVGFALSDYEQVEYNDDVIYWSVKLSAFSKSRWSKIASTKANNLVTIRTANTVKRILMLMND